MVKREIRTDLSVLPDTAVPVEQRRVKKAKVLGYIRFTSSDSSLTIVPNPELLVVKRETK